MNNIMLCDNLCGRNGAEGYEIILHEIDTELHTEQRLLTCPFYCKECLNKIKPRKDKYFIDGIKVSKIKYEKRRKIL